MDLQEHTIWSDLLWLHRSRSHWPSSSPGDGAKRHAVILAGDDGIHPSRLTHRLTDVSLPKQYRAFTPDRVTLLQRAARRARQMVDGSIRVVVCRDHASLAEQQLCGHTGCRLMVQPDDHGTALALLLALIDLAVEAPEAQVVVLPADHGFEDEQCLTETVDAAWEAVEAHPDRVVLLAAPADHAATDFTWLVPGDERASEVQRVERIQVHPDATTAARLWAGGAAWSAMMLVGTAHSITQRFLGVAPSLVRLFVYHAALPPGERQCFLEQASGALGNVDLFQHVLEGAQSLWMLELPTEAGWTDLATDARIRRWARMTVRASGEYPASV